MRSSGDEVLGLRVPEDDVGVATWGYCSLLRVHTEDSCRRCGGDLDKSLQRDLSRVDTEVIEELQAVLNPGTAIGNLAEVVLAELFLVGKTERAVVGRNHLQIIRGETIQKLRLFFLFAQWRSKDIFCLVETFAGHLVLNRQEKILRAGFSKGWNAAVTSLANLIESIFAREVYDVHRDAGDFGEGTRAVHGFGLGLSRPRERVI